ncbi:MAG: hypothetical protein N4A62_07560 [Marinisporobacter sp.]|jgi:hypothetical protein|nr:hypothetical protein [Marinisporobacter sp.]
MQNKRKLIIYASLTGPIVQFFMPRTKRVIDRVMGVCVEVE